MHDFPMHVGEATANAVVIERQSLVIDSQQMQYSRVEIVPCRSMLDRFPANLIGIAVSEARL